MSISRGRTPIKRFQKLFLNLLWRSLLFANYVTWESVRGEVNTLAHCLGASFGEHHDLGLVLWTWPATTCCTKLLDVKQISSIGFQLTFEGGAPNMASRFGPGVRHGWKRLGEYSTVWIFCAAGPKGFLSDFGLKRGKTIFGPVQAAHPGQKLLGVPAPPRGEHLPVQLAYALSHSWFIYSIITIFTFIVWDWKPTINTELEKRASKKQRFAFRGLDRLREGIGGIFRSIGEFRMLITLHQSFWKWSCRQPLSVW